MANGRRGRAVKQSGSERPFLRLFVVHGVNVISARNCVTLQTAVSVISAEQNKTTDCFCAFHLALIHISLQMQAASYIIGFDMNLKDFEVASAH